MHPIAISVLLCLMGREVYGARILGIFPIAAKSHLQVTSPVMHALAKKGHDVTIFSPFSTDFNASNYREIVFEQPRITAEDRKEMIKLLTMNFVVRQFAFLYVGTMSTEFALNTTEAKSLMESEETYDLIVMEQFANEAFYAYVHKFNCPLVLISTFGTTTTINEIFGNSAPYSYVPFEFLAFNDRMTLFERLQNTLATIFTEIARKYFYMPRQQALAVKYLSDFGLTIPPLEEIMSQADLILINSHPAFSTPRPYMPNMKDVAGMHLKPSKPLPADLQRYMDSSKNGVILFSLGSAIQCSQMPERVIQVLKGAFERLPYDILWKWEDDTMTNKPKNVHIGKWLPQNDILAHPNVKLFLTHGGISSTMETVYHAVPIVGIPVFGDQSRNILFAQNKGYAEILDFNTMTSDEIYKTIMKVVTNPDYRKNVKKVSEYWRGELNHPLDEAVHWVEYVLKHGGAKHLKAAITEQNFIQYMLLDVAIVILLTLAVIYFLISRTFRFLCKKSSFKRNSKKNN